MEKLLEGVCYNASNLDEDCAPIQSASVGSRVYIFLGRSKQKDFTVTRWRPCTVVSHHYLDERPIMKAEDLHGHVKDTLVWDGKFWRVQNE